MSKEQICEVTLAALSFWSASNTKESFRAFLEREKRMGRWWGADETLEDVPNA